MHTILIQLAGTAVVLAVSHFLVMWAWSKKYKSALGAEINSLTLQSYKTVNEVRMEVGLPTVTAEQGGNLILNRVLAEQLLQKKN